MCDTTVSSDGDHRLDLLQLGQPLAEGLALQHVGLRDLDRPPGAADVAHAVRQPRRLEPDLRVGQTAADLAEHRAVADGAAFEADLGMAADAVGADRRDV